MDHLRTRLCISEINEQNLSKKEKISILYSSFNQNLKGNKIFDIYEDSDGTNGS